MMDVCKLFSFANDFKLKKSKQNNELSLSLPPKINHYKASILKDDELGRKHDNSRKTLIAAMMRNISHKNRKEYFRKYLIF